MKSGKSKTPEEAHKVPVMRYHNRETSNNFTNVEKLNTGRKGEKKKKKKKKKRHY